MEKIIQWHSAVRTSAYDLSYAAFYDQCALKAKPLASGAALCLVYDLTTTTPHLVSLARGAGKQLQVDVQESLVKRFKIHTDAWHVVSECLSKRPFAYLVEGDSFATLRDDEQKIA